MKVIQLITALIITLFTQQLLQAQHTEYYRHLVFRESPYADLRGIHQIDKAKAEAEAHYRFVYDEEEQLIEVSHRIGDDVIANNNNWDSFMWFSPKVTIQYTSGEEVREYYDHLGQQIAAHGNVYRAVFKKDPQGRRTAMRFYDEKGQPSESEWGIHRYQWTQHTGESVMEERFDLNGEPKTIRPEFTFYTVQLVYGDDDYLDFIYHLDENGELINNTMKAGLDRIVYDNEGNFSRWMVFDKDRKPVEGNAPGFAIGEHLYDCRGNKVGLRGFDVEGNLKAFPSGGARVVNTYDRFNNQTEVKVYDLAGALLQRVGYEYSADGRRLEWIRFLDAEGNLVDDPRSNLAAIHLTYSEDGRVASRVRYNAELQEIKEI
ncbi:hypothetical protein [Robertkochia sediminum]|uniref:hypothetical protein n=1 Tax=Robertkochia sediminum TaxID=2785326 RepID=UPI0019325FF2|nr:hypothetical protein [Robertkochia sediminum]MBL7472038.1 hypothetical protein [Robertkochia sediminum]